RPRGLPGPAAPPHYGTGVSDRTKCALYRWASVSPRFPSGDVDDHRNQTDWHVFVVLDAQTALFDRMELPGERAHLRSVLRARRDRRTLGAGEDCPVGAGKELAVPWPPELPRREDGRLGIDPHRLVLTGENTAGGPGAESDTAMLDILDLDGVVQDAL